MYIGLPLIDDIEGPTLNESAWLVLGARYINVDTCDLNFDACFAGVIFSLSCPPDGFTNCILSCSESIKVKVTGTDIISLGFNPITRKLQLTGRASVSVYIEVIRTVSYEIKASRFSFFSLRFSFSVRITINDGRFARSFLLSLRIEISNRRRREISTPSFTRRRLLSLPSAKNDNLLLSSSSSINTHLPQVVFWSVACLVGIVMITISVYAFLRKRQASAKKADDV